MHSFYGQHLDLDVLQVKQENCVKEGNRGNLLQFRRSVTQKYASCMLFYKWIHLAATLFLLAGTKWRAINFE